MRRQQTHRVVTTKPWCGDCGKERAALYCDTCCYPVGPDCMARHPEVN